MPQFTALCERRHITIRHGHYRAALVAATLINVNMVEGTPVSPFDFLPGLKEEEPELDREAIARNARCFLMAQMELRNGE